MVYLLLGAYQEKWKCPTVITNFLYFYVIKKRERKLNQVTGRWKDTAGRTVFPVASQNIMSPCLWKLIH